METNSKESEMLPGSQALQTVCREKDGLMEGLSTGTALSVQPPGPLPMTRTLRKTLQDSGKTLA